MIYFLFALLIFITLLKLIKRKKVKSKLKTNRILFLAKPKCLTFTSICLKLNFLSLKQTKIKTLKELKQIDHIISCVLYNRPTLYTTKINFELLQQNGINKNYPLLVFEKVDVDLINCLIEAKKYVRFNIVIRFNDKMNIDQKLKKHFDYKILYPNCDYELFSNIMKLNCYEDVKFKIVKSKEYLIIKNNKEKYIDTSKSFNIKNINFNNVYIEIKNIKYNSNYYILKIYNKTNSNQTIKINYDKNLPVNYYKFIKISNGLYIYDILKDKSYYLLNNFNIKFSFANKYELPYVGLKKQVRLLAYQTVEMILYVGNHNLSKSQIEQNVHDYYDSLQNLFNCKIQFKDRKLEYMFNVYLPKQIEIFGVSKKVNCSSKNLQEVADAYKQKQITAYDFYVWLKHMYFGLVDSLEYLSIKPLCRDDFNIVYSINDKEVFISIINSNIDERYMVLDGVKYKNYLIIPKNKLNTIKDVMLVI